MKAVELLKNRIVLVIISLVTGVAGTLLCLNHERRKEFPILSEVFERTDLLEIEDIVSFLKSEPNSNEISSQLYKAARSDAIRLLLKKNTPIGMERGALIDDPYMFSLKEQEDGILVFDTVLDQKPEVVVHAGDVHDKFYRSWKVTFRILAPRSACERPK